MLNLVILRIDMIIIVIDTVNISGGSRPAEQREPSPFPDSCFSQPSTLHLAPALLQGAATVGRDLGGGPQLARFRQCPTPPTRGRAQSPPGGAARAILQPLGPTFLPVGGREPAEPSGESGGLWNLVQLLAPFSLLTP